MDDLVERLLAAIDAKEQLALIADGLPDWRLADDPMGSLLVVDGSGDVVIYDEGAPRPTQAAHIVDNDPAAVLRRCAADRRTVESYRKTCEIRDEIAGRGLPGWQLPPADLDTWDRAEREAAIMEEGVRNLADGYGITETEESRCG